MTDADREQAITAYRKAFIEERLADQRVQKSEYQRGELDFLSV
jgi:hypothetical protein